MKLSRIILSVLLVLTMILSVACNPADKPDETDTKAPDTQAPDTKAPDTQAPDTQAPETQAPETQPVEEKTIEIGTVDELLAFAKAINEEGETYEGTTVLLTADLDLDGVEWKPIGHGNIHNYAMYFPSDRYFGGTFDGQGHVIKNLVIQSSDDGIGANGFFGVTCNATIKNVGLEAMYNITATATTHFNGHLIGWAIDCVVDNCYVIGGGMTEGSHTGMLQELGGIIGVCASGASTTVTNCYFNGTVGGDMGGYTVGGIVGYTPNQFPGLYVENCYSNGVYISVANNPDNYGGIWSCTEQDENGGSIELVNCFTTASCVYGTRYEGGKDLTVTNCEANLTNETITADMLGDAFVADTTGINGGFPILAWQQK